MTRRPLAALLWVAVTLTGVIGIAGQLGSTPDPAGASNPQLISTGSSFAGVAITQWEGQFNEEYGGDINFTVSSSILGMNAFCQKTVDFGATDISYATQQSICSTSQVPYPFQYMPDVAGGLAFEYNLQAANGQRVTNLILNGPTLLGIFTGSIKNWNNPQIQALNPNIPMPNQPITAYYRSDASGENYLLSDYFLHVDPGPITTFQQEASVPTTPGTPSATWASFSNGVPQNLNSLEGVNGSDAASQGPAQNQGGIAYVEYAYAKNVHLPVASVINAAGQPVQPDSYNVAVALTAAILYSDLTQNLGGVYTNPNPDAYPISAYSYFIAQCVPSQAAAQNFACDSGGPVTMGSGQGSELSQFISYVACGGQSQMASLGYSPIPPNLVEDDFQAAGRLPGGTSPPPPTPSTCANPYITGALQPVGGPTVVGTTNPGSDLTGAGAAVAAVGAAHATTAVGGSTSKGGTGTSTTTAGATSAASAAAAAAQLKKALNPLNNAQQALARQSGLTNASAGALSKWSPAQVALWSTVFALVIIGVPLVLWVTTRRRRERGSETGAT
ncbi:MAG TPA: substrate-binding domain-containing protein [Acidimicrobiales bacterium]|nr:substrate-binding domain-containing protein [Acidimicrobiales bacterium]